MAMTFDHDHQNVALHYGAWVPERQERLTKMFKRAYREKPKRVGISRGLKQLHRGRR